MIIVTAILSLICGGALLGWVMKGFSYPASLRPLILTKEWFLIIVTVIIIALLGLGLYLFWGQSKVIVILLVTLSVILWIRGRYIASDKFQTRKILRIYESSLLKWPNAELPFIYKVVFRQYLRSIGWNEDKVDLHIQLVFESNSYGESLDDLKEFITDLISLYSPIADDAFLRTANISESDSHKEWNKWFKKRDKREQSVSETVDKYFDDDLE